MATWNNKRSLCSVAFISDFVLNHNETEGYLRELNSWLSRAVEILKLEERSFTWQNEDDSQIGPLFQCGSQVGCLCKQAAVISVLLSDWMTDLKAGERKITNITVQTLTKRKVLPAWRDYIWFISSPELSLYQIHTLSYYLFPSNHKRFLLLSRFFFFYFILL